MRVAVVTAGYGGSWDETQLVARRLAGALACGADVDVLIPDQAGPGDECDGGVRLLRFPGTAAEPARQLAWRRVAIGPGQPDDAFHCSCHRYGRHQEPLPVLVEEQLLLAEGGDAPELYRHLRETPYDLVVFVGLHTPSAYWGAKAVPEGGRVMLVPATTDEQLAWLGLHGHTLERAERLLVCTQGERSMWAERLGPDEGKIENINFLVGVNPLARLSDPHDFDRQRYLIVAQDWTVPGGPMRARLALWAELLARHVGPLVQLRAVGPGSERHPLGIQITSSRLDMWRWMSRAVAVLDPEPKRLVGRQVLEALLYKVPVIVHARGGAAREHAEVGNGGLWFRTDDEFCAVVEALLDGDLRQILGEQGCSYAQHRYADTDSFIKGVAKVCLS